MHDLEELVRRLHMSRADFPVRDLIFLVIAGVLSGACRALRGKPVRTSTGRRPNQYRGHAVLAASP